MYDTRNTVFSPVLFSYHSWDINEVQYPIFDRTARKSLPVHSSSDGAISKTNPSCTLEVKKLKGNSFLLLDLLLDRKRFKI